MVTKGKEKQLIRFPSGVVLFIVDRNGRHPPFRGAASSLISHGARLKARSPSTKQSFKPLKVN